MARPEQLGEWAALDGKVACVTVRFAVYAEEQERLLLIYKREIARLKAREAGYERRIERALRLTVLPAARRALKGEAD